MVDNCGNKSIIPTIIILIIATLFVGGIMYAIWMAYDPSICKRKACTVIAWGIRALIIAMPIGITIFVHHLFNQPEKTESPHRTYPKGYDKNNYIDLKKMGANDKQ